MTKKNEHQSGSATQRNAAAFGAIGGALRQMHQKVVTEPIPDDFLKLLAQLDKPAPGQKGREQ